MLMWHICSEKFISLSSLQCCYHRNLFFSLKKKKGFVVLLIIEKSYVELVALIREGQCLGEKFLYIIEFWLAAWIGGACWYSTAMGTQRLQKDECIG